MPMLPEPVASGATKIGHGTGRGHRRRIPAPLPPAALPPYSSQRPNSVA